MFVEASIVNNSWTEEISLRCGRIFEWKLFSRSCSKWKSLVYFLMVSSRMSIRESLPNHNRGRSRSKNHGLEKVVSIFHGTFRVRWSDLLVYSCREILLPRNLFLHLSPFWISRSRYTIEISQSFFYVKFFFHFVQTNRSGDFHWPE